MTASAPLTPPTVENRTLVPLHPNHQYLPFPPKRPVRLREGPPGEGCNPAGGYVEEHEAGNKKVTHPVCTFLLKR